VLTERIQLGGVMCELSDTAGQRDTDDPVEKIGVDRAAKAMESADIVLIVLDSSQELTAEDEILLKNADERTIIVLNKNDLARKLNIPGAMEISAASGEGIAELIREMEKRVQITDTIQDRMTHQRHIALAKRALASLQHAIDGIDAGFELDLAEIDLKEALEALSEITGEDASEEVIDRVFKNFCVGK
jgi:tRNA modification GTPase